MARTLLNVPKTARRGEVIEVRTLIAHRMDSGFIVDSQGRKVPRDILQRFTCRYNGEQVFAADLFSAVAANPYIVFYTVATESGALEFEWKGDNGFSQVERVAITVT
jgi:sulfur-oxidizing protein SoxZ